MEIIFWDGFEEFREFAPIHRNIRLKKEKMRAQRKKLGEGDLCCTE